MRELRSELCAQPLLEEGRCAVLAFRPGGVAVQALAYRNALALCPAKQFEQRRASAFQLACATRVRRK